MARALTRLWRRSPGPLLRHTSLARRDVLRKLYYANAEAALVRNGAYRIFEDFTVIFHHRSSYTSLDFARAIDQTNEQARSICALSLAIRLKIPKLVRTVVAYMTQNELSEGSYLHEAMATGNLDILKILLQKGCNPNARAVYLREEFRLPSPPANAIYNCSLTPLMVGSLAGHAAAVRTLLEEGADPSACVENAVTRSPRGMRDIRQDLIVCSKWRALDLAKFAAHGTGDGSVVHLFEARGIRGGDHRGCLQCHEIDRSKARTGRMTWRDLNVPSEEIA